MEPSFQHLKRLKMQLRRHSGNHMVNNERVELLTDRLLGHLKAESLQDDSRKLLWLVEHLDEYLERWLGFASMEDIGVEATIHNETFYVVLAAVNVINRILPNSSQDGSFPLEEWKHFCNALTWIQRAPDLSELKLVPDMYESFRAKMSSVKVRESRQSSAFYI